MNVAKLPLFTLTIVLDHPLLIPPCAAVGDLRNSRISVRLRKIYERFTILYVTENLVLLYIHFTFISLHYTPP